jgi:putative ABC transport system permease protein
LNTAINWKNKLKARKKISPDDESGVVVRNNAKNLEDTFAF